jgi:hypothetical protein
MATKKSKEKQPAKAPSSPLELSVPPAPLPAPATGDAEVDELAAAFASNSPASIDAGKRLRLSPKKLDGAALAALLTDAALDYGVIRWNEAEARKLPAKERRAYQAAYEAAYSGRHQRAAWLGVVAHAAAHHDEGVARLADVARGQGDWAVRQIVATALFTVCPDDRAALDAIATMISIEGLAHEVITPRALGARAILRRDRHAAYDELHPLLSSDRAGAVLSGLCAEAPRIDERWLDALLPMLGGGRLDLDFSILDILVKLPSEPRMLEHVLRHAGDPTKITFVADQTLKALAHCGDARATPFLLRALAVSTRSDLVLEALRRSGDPAAAPAIRAYIEELQRSAEAARLGGVIDLAVAAARELEAIGPAPEPAKAPEPAPPTERQRRDLRASSPREVPEEVPPQRQRAELVDTLASIGVNDPTELLRSSIRLFSTRSEDAQIPVGATKLGGCPDLPPGVPWPHIGEGVLSFVAQFRLEDLAPLDDDHLLPDTGLLSFFIMDEFDPPEALGAVRVLLSEGPFERREIPASFDRRPADQVLREPFAACTLRATRLLHVAPPDRPAVARVVSADKRADYETNVCVAFSSEHQLLGFREEPYEAPPEGSELLFRCISDDEAGMEWGDVQDLCFYIPTADLRARDFSNVTTMLSQ